MGAFGYRRFDLNIRTEEHKVSRVIIFFEGIYLVLDYWDFVWSGYVAGS